MPLLALKCPQGHTWEALTTINDPDCERCPTCLSKEIETQVAGMAFHPEHQVSREDLAIVMENKRDLESQSARILSGELGIEERGPKEYRPQLPEHMKKRYY